MIYCLYYPLDYGIIYQRYGVDTVYFGKARGPVRSRLRISLYRRFYMYMGLITLILAGIAVIAIVAINLIGKR